ncbi:MAG: hypothetical protein ACJAT4_000363 [Granulosicoccus sp.]|jgi:hypothetical protein
MITKLLSTEILSLLNKTKCYMNESKKPATFISYSRRQLYFAESLALHLQKENLNIWFDLQQLHAGTVWSDSLKDGISEAKTLVLIVSKASLASEYVEVEWKGVAAKGGQLVLVIFESVKLPDELKGLPTFDFRTGFEKNISALSSYLKGEAEPKFDKIISYNPFSWFSRKPAAVLKIIGAQFSIPILLILMFIFHGIFRSPPEMDDSLRTRFLVLGSLSLLMSFWYVIPLLRHKLSYKKVKRSVFNSTLLLVPFFFIMLLIIVRESKPITNELSLMWGILCLIVVINLYVYLFVLRRSIDFLRWMQPEDSLQKLRRRVHQPLIPKEVFDVDMESDDKSKSVLYTIHHDSADKPLAKWITKYFDKVGHQKVTIAENGEYHIAILSNRSSVAWVQEVTQTYAGKLVFVVVSTIEFTDSLKDTGRYQWVDAREMEKRDILGLAKSLGDTAAWKREAALESTPDKIDTLKMPSGIKLFRNLLVIFGIYVLIIGLTNLMPGGEETSLISIEYNLYLFLVGLVSLWVAAKGLIQRKIPSIIVYGSTLLNLILVSWFGNILLFDGLIAQKWVLLVVTIPMLILSAIEGRYWLPTFAKANSDEVGINKTIIRSYWKRRVIVITIWIILFSGLAFWASTLK